MPRPAVTERGVLLGLRAGLAAPGTGVPGREPGRDGGLAHQRSLRGRDDRGRESGHVRELMRALPAHPGLVRPSRDTGPMTDDDRPYRALLNAMGSPHGADLAAGGAPAGRGAVSESAPSARAMALATVRGLDMRAFSWMAAQAPESHAGERRPRFGGAFSLIGRLVRDFFDSGLADYVDYVLVWVLQGRPQGSPQSPRRTS